jgi:cutinase
VVGVAVALAVTVLARRPVTPVRKMTFPAAAAMAASPRPIAAAPSPFPAAIASVPGGATAARCPAVNVVFARGTGEPTGPGEVGAPFVRVLTADLPGKTVTSYAVNYAADELQTSAGPGATDMTDHIVSMAARCPGTIFVIGGYSQGASVTDIAIGIPTMLGTGTTIPAPLAQRIAAVVVFGNPLNLTGETIASASPRYARKADEFCDTGDPVCGNGGNVQAHLDYAANGSVTQGARFAAGQVKAAG